MQKRLFSLLLLLCLFANLLIGCAQTSGRPEAGADPTAAPTAAPTEVPTEAPTQEPLPTEPTETEPPRQGYRFADRAEGADMLLAERDYYENLTQNDLNYRLQKLDATLPELEAFARAQILEFTDGEKAVIDKDMQILLSTCEARGYRLPALSDVVFVKTTMQEECGAGAYTHGTKIFLGEYLVSYALSEEENLQQYFRMILAHEMFHCLTRNHSDFRRDLYGIFGFTVADEDFVFSPEVAGAIISNPDVGHHDSYAAFEIDGVKRDCVVIFTAAPFEQPGDSFFNSMQTCLVPIDTLDEMIPSENAANFWDVFGRNTSYVIDPEETLADNFGYLLVYGTNVRYETPELILAIDAYLKER